MKYIEIYKNWLNSLTEQQDIDELLSIKKNDEEIKSRFGTMLSFGTAGLRGILGVGTNRMNTYTVRWATKGLADYINGRYGGGDVAIAYDSRIMSREFAKEAALVLASHGITAYMFKELMPTPMLSYAVRALSCKAGIVITASHNSKEYNGFKAYGSDGCQMTLEDTNAVLDKLSQIDVLSCIPNMDFNEGVEKGFIKIIGRKIIDGYFDAVLEQQLNPGVCVDYPLSVVYSPLNGAGNIPVRRILDSIGVTNVVVVPEQELPDGNFPTAPYPNPEMPETLELGLELSKKVGADIFLATDPDSDRVGFAVRDGKEFRVLTGNEIGFMLLNYIITAHNENRTMPENPVTVRSVVSTALIDRIAEDNNIEVITVLTGFKYIGEQILLLEQKGEDKRFIFGFEESCGYLAGSYARDKDAIFASMMLSEMTSYYKSKGLTLLDVLEDIYEEYGYYINTVVNIAFSDADGIKTMKDIMNRVRSTTILKKIGGLEVIEYLDYETGKRVDRVSGEEGNIHLPSTNMVEFKLLGGANIMIRPSGTEPKMKIYITAAEKSLELSKQLTKKLVTAAKTLIK